MLKCYFDHLLSCLKHTTLHSQSHTDKPWCHLKSILFIQPGITNDLRHHYKLQDILFQCFKLDFLQFNQISLCLNLTESQTNFSPLMCFYISDGKQLCVGIQDFLSVLEQAKTHVAEILQSVQCGGQDFLYMSAFPSPIAPVSPHSTLMKKFVEESDDDVLLIGCCLISV